MASTADSLETPAKTTAGDVLVDYLRLQVTELQDNAVHVREDHPDGVHQMRMSARRLRSALATAKGLFDDGDGSVGKVRSELKWLSEILGKARDPQVIQERLASMLEEEPEHLVIASAQERLDSRLGAAAAEGRNLVLGALDSDRYSRLVQAAAKLVAAPPLSGKASKKPRKTLLKLVAKDIRRLRRKAEVLNLQALQNPPNMEALLNRNSLQTPTVRDIAFHEVRKAAKRVRYAAEAASPVAGKRAGRLEKAAHGLQKILGLHQDSVVARVLLVELGIEDRSGEDSAFTFGRLHALEEQRAAESEKAYSKAWKKSWKHFKDSAPL